jgi:hypothetical protein
MFGGVASVGWGPFRTTSLASLALAMFAVVALPEKVGR